MTNAFMTQVEANQQRAHERHLEKKNGRLKKALYFVGGAVAAVAWASHQGTNDSHTN